MNLRLLVAIVTTLLDDVLIIVLLWLILPRVGVHLPLAVLVTLSILWTVFSVIIYRAGTRALRRKPTKGLTDMTGMQGIVVRDLAPEGMVKVKGEIWEAQSSGIVIRSGEKVVVESQTGLVLTVKKV